MDKVRVQEVLARADRCDPAVGATDGPAQARDLYRGGEPAPDCLIYGDSRVG